MQETVITRAAWFGWVEKIKFMLDVLKIPREYCYKGASSSNQNCFLVAAYSKEKEAMQYLDTVDPSWKFQHDSSGRSALQCDSEILSSLRLNFNQGGDSIFESH